MKESLPMKNLLQMEYPVYKPSLNGNEKQYVNECIDSSWISSRGEFIGKFEKSFANFVNIEYATGVCNGTVAIHLALVALGINEGDEIIVPTLTYIASANPIVQVGAKPVFVDSDINTWQMSPEDIEAKITSKTKAIIVVHLYGYPCDMDKIMNIAKKYNLAIIEDCAEAIGTTYKNKHVGTFGDIATFSFFGNKTITCGEGGMVVTNDITLHDRLVHFKGQGLAKHREYWHDTIGFNYRMTNIQAAIGLAQLEQIELFLAKKQQIAKCYCENLKNLPITFHNPPGDIFHSFWMCSILVEKHQLRDSLRDYLKSLGIETRPLFNPIHTMPMYAKQFTKHPIAENLSARGINLPSYPGLEKKDIKFICEKIKEFYEG